MHRIKRIHFVGIGGSGMSGIAEVLLNLGYIVQGTDLKENDVTSHLRMLGATISLGHAADRIIGADVVVVSSAVDQRNPEVEAARVARIPVVRRAEMLAELMRFRVGIAIAGTHGKTTTTSLVASILAEAGEDPTFVIGGRLKSAASNARLGAGRYLVAEADESDASFLHLQPMAAVVTNIDNDHLATYSGDFKKLKQAFTSFLHNLPFYGFAVLCLDDVSVQAILQDVARPIITYGIETAADIRAYDIQREGQRSSFKVRRAGIASDLAVTLSVPGRHNVLNALAAIAVATEFEIPDAAIQKALASFQGIDRRLQVLADTKTHGRAITVIDDYGHHPTELRASLEAIRQGWPERRVVLAFQPHRFTRTRDLLDDFAEVLSSADALFITEVYAAGEAPIADADGRAICRAVRTRGQVEPVFCLAVDDLPNAITPLLRDRDVLVMMGAGSISNVAHAFAAQLAQGHSND